MPAKLTTTIKNIRSIPSSTNAELVNEFYEFMNSNGSSERHQNNSLKAIIAFAKFLGSDISFLDIQRKEQVTSFLDTKIKSVEQDPDKKWMNTWNDYARRIKHFLRWLYNEKTLHSDGKQSLQPSDWQTPHFAKIK